MRQWILGLCAVLTMLSPICSYAAEKEDKGILGLTASYSESVTPQGGDEFTITLANDKKDTFDLVFQAYEHQDKAQYFELDPGNYHVYSITYNGKSKSLITEGFTMPLKFTVYELEHIDTSIAIGEERGTVLASTYLNTYSVINGETVDWIDYYSENNRTTSNNSKKADSEEKNIIQKELPDDEEEITSNKSYDANEKVTEVKDNVKNNVKNDTNDDAKTKDDIDDTDTKNKIKTKDTRETNLFLKNLPIFFMIGIAGGVVFIFHKKGKI